jgi:ArsR family transcriptional regulator, arsenate/arsenite/antimonite-responsive transcriptional repressor
VTVRVLTHQDTLIYIRAMVTVASRLRTGITDRASTARLFHALSDETRLSVLEMLRGGERCVCDLQDAVGAAQSRLSFHLKVLKDAGLVTDRKEGRWSYYTLVAERLAQATTALGTLAAPAPAAALPLHSLARAPRPSSDVARTTRAGRASRSRAVARNGDGCC